MTSLLKVFMIKPKQYKYISIVGSPTIENGIISNIDSSNYIRYATADILSGHNWEICLKIYWNGTTNGAIYLRVGDGASYFRVGTNRDITFLGYLTTNAQVWVHALNFYNNTAGWYYIKLKYEKDEGSFTTFFGKNSAEMSKGIKVVKGAGLELRYLTSSRYIMSNYNTNGAIDLNGCYIKIENDQYYFKINNA